MRPEFGWFGTQEQWMLYAKADLALAQAPLPEGGMYEQLCFHAQQAVEKSLKAILVAADVDIPYTHNLQKLIDLLPAEVPPNADVVDAARLTAYAISTRYPGSEEPVLEEDYREAVRLAAGVVAWATKYLGLDETG
jgi:HEPN domain-containing protein